MERASRRYFDSLARSVAFPGRQFAVFVRAFEPHDPRLSCDDEQEEKVAPLSDLALLKAACKLVNLFCKEFVTVHAGSLAKSGPCRSRP